MEICSTITNTKTVNRFKRLETDFQKLYGDTYCYNKSVYQGMRKKITILCKKHGEFQQSPINHLQGGCFKCGIENTIKNRSSRMDTERFIKKASSKYNNLYNYDKVIYTSTLNPIIVTCSIHGDFTIRPVTHLQGSGCPWCSNYGFNSNEKAKLYYVRIVDTTTGITAYKIGVTNTDVKNRYTDWEFEKMTILYEERFEIGRDAYKREQEIIRDCKKWKYTGPDLLHGGNTELFSEDIMNK